MRGYVYVCLWVCEIKGETERKVERKQRADLRFSLQNWKTTIKLQWNKVCITFNKFPRVWFSHLHWCFLEALSSNLPLILMNSSKRDLTWGLTAKLSQTPNACVLFCPLLLKIVQQTPNNLNVTFVVLQAHISFQQPVTFQSCISLPFLTLGRTSAMKWTHPWCKMCRSTPLLPWGRLTPGTPRRWGR